MSSELGLFLRTLTERIKPELLLERVVGGPPDDWQLRLLSAVNGTARECEEPKSVFAVLASRRIGKSTTVAVMAGQELSKPEHQVIILSKSLPQSQLLFAKIALTWDRMGLPIQQKRRTMTGMHLNNGSSVICIPAGQNGESARGYGVRDGLLIFDEAAFIPSAVYASALSIAEANAKTILISTPGGKSGKFYEMMTDREKYPEVERIRACSLDVLRMAKLVAQQRKLLSTHEFEVEHGLSWIGGGQQFFDSRAIERAFTDTPALQLKGDLYAGVV